MGLSIDRAYRLQKKLADRVNGIFLVAIVCHPTSEQINQALLDKVFANKMPDRVRSYLDGMVCVHRAYINNYFLVWLHSLDGELLTREQVDGKTLVERAEQVGTNFVPKDYRSPWQRINSELSRHCWRDGINGAPLRDKPYDARFRANKEAT